MDELNFNNTIYLAQYTQNIVFQHVIDIKNINEVFYILSLH